MMKNWIRMVVLGGLLAAVSARAATFVVSNTNDAGLGSLRSAIDQANVNAGADTIAFAIPGTGPHTIKVITILPTITNDATSIRGDTQAGFSNNVPVIQILGPSGAVANDYGLWSQAIGTTIRCVRVSGFKTAGILADGFTPKKVKVEGCVLDQNADGIHGGGSGTMIGGTSTNLRNVIINNQSNGIFLIYGQATVQGNYIGVAADGVTPAGNGENGIRLFYLSGTNTIRGATNYPQVISGNGLNGILGEPNGSYIVAASDNDIEGNFIGTDATGTNAVPNGGAGIRIWGGSRNTVGGLTAAQRNVIAGNAGAGVSIEGLHPIYNQGRDNEVIGNYIGLGADGETVVSNYYGVFIYDTFANRVGGTAPGSGNRFGGEEREHVMMRSTYQPCTDNTVQGNWFGISVSTQRLSGALAGVYLFGAANNLVGGTTTNARNYFGGANTGVAITGTNAQFNSVIGNWIGIGPGGVQMGNNSYGVEIFNASRNQIGGVYTNEGNVISGNQYYGVRIFGTNSSANVVMGNIIGLDPTASFSISNRYTGVVVADGAYSNRIGGTNAATMNVIAGNGGAGIVISDTNTYGNSVVANYVGLNPSGVRLFNDGYGVDILNSPRNRIGGVYTNQGNVLSGNQWYGVYIRGAGSSENVVEGNIIGLDPTATFVVSNRYQGVVVSGGAYSNRIGGSSAQRMNVVAGNSFGGIQISGTDTCWNVVYRNLVGQTTNGVAIPNSTGIEVVDAPNNSIGVNGIGNYVAGNSSRGIYIRGAATNTTVRGNYVGMQYPGLSTALPNGSDGILVDASAATIGGTNAGDVNYASGNAASGIRIDDGGTNSRVTGNIVGLDITGTAIISNRVVGVYINAPGVTLGGTEPYARNIISGNQTHGVQISPTASNVTLLNNYIGVDGFGTTAIRNTGRGIFSGGSSVTIGGTNALEGNVIGGNNSYGIEIHTGTQVRIYGNSIGIGADGVSVVSNSYGVVISGGAREVVIGTTNGSGGNVIARNSNAELLLQNTPGGTRVEDNFIGVQNYGIPFASAQAGFAIDVNNSPGNQIIGNVIGQNDVGIRLNNTGTFNTVVQGNFIGEYNLESISNLSWGIWIINSSSNTIGGTAAAQRNFISRNFGGIAVTNNGGFVAVANVLAPNLIASNGTRLNIELGPNGFNANDALDADSGANRLQNRPTLTNAITLFPSLSIVYAQGVLTSAPNTTFLVDIFRSGSTNAESRAYLGRVPVTTDGGGFGTFSAGFPISMATGTYLTATATDPEGNTSEFAVAPTGTVAKTTADFDGDLIPDYWENLYGLNAFFSNAGLDLDGDGVSDLNEYIADTPANDPTKFLKIVQLDGAAPRTITFPSSPLRRYDLQFNTDLTTNLWTQHGGTITGQTPQTTFTDTNQPPLRHYRIGVKLP